MTQKLQIQARRVAALAARSERRSAFSSSIASLIHLAIMAHRNKSATFDLDSCRLILF
jgi:hypothetical protein